MQHAAKKAAIMPRLWAMGTDYAIKYILANIIYFARKLRSAKFSRFEKNLAPKPF